MATKQELAERDADVLQALEAACADIGSAARRDGITPHMRNRRGLTKAMVDSSLERLTLAGKVRKSNKIIRGRLTPAYSPF